MVSDISDFNFRKRNFDVAYIFILAMFLLGAGLGTFCIPKFEYAVIDNFNFTYIFIFHLILVFVLGTTFVGVFLLPLFIFLKGFVITIFPVEMVAGQGIIGYAFFGVVNLILLVLTYYSFCVSCHIFKVVFTRNSVFDIHKFRGYIKRSILFVVLFLIFIALYIFFERA